MTDFLKSTTVEELLSTRVQAGAKWLDGVKDYWADCVNTDVLDLGDRRKDVLGQAFDTEAHLGRCSDGYSYAVGRFAHPSSDSTDPFPGMAGDWPVRLGFTPDALFDTVYSAASDRVTAHQVSWDAQSEHLKQCWEQEIRARQFKREHDTDEVKVITAEPAGEGV